MLLGSINNTTKLLSKNHILDLCVHIEKLVNFTVIAYVCSLEIWNNWVFQIFSFNFFKYQWLLIFIFRCGY